MVDIDRELLVVCTVLLVYPERVDGVAECRRGRLLEEAARALCSCIEGLPRLTTPLSDSSALWELDAVKGLAERELL